MKEALRKRYREETRESASFLHQKLKMPFLINVMASWDRRQRDRNQLCVLETMNVEVWAANEEL